MSFIYGCNLHKQWECVRLVVCQLTSFTSHNAFENYVYMSYWDCEDSPQFFSVFPHLGLSVPLFENNVLNPLFNMVGISFLFSMIQAREAWTAWLCSLTFSNMLIQVTAVPVLGDPSQEWWGNGVVVGEYSTDSRGKATRGSPFQ